MIELLSLLPLAMQGFELGWGIQQDKKNREAQERQNYQDRQWQKYMYDLQRNDALSDFKMANEYNHPLQQMERLRQAGLNPNLVYGKGADMAAAQIRGSQSGGGGLPAPQSRFFPSGTGTAIADLMMKQAQTDNLHEQTAVIKKEGLLKDAQLAKIGTETARNTFDLKLADELRQVTIERAIADLQKVEVEIIYQLDENQRRKLQSAQDLQRTMQEIALQKLNQAKTQVEIQEAKQNLRNLQQTEAVRKVEEELANAGIMKDDPWYYRLFMLWLDRISKKVGTKPQQSPEELKDMIKRGQVPGG